jgi:SAM-dependent methyltransferase
MDNPHVYPLKYALAAVTDPSGCILEAGCGAGRVLRYFHEHGYDIIGMDYIGEAIEKLKAADPTLKAETGDISDLHYPDQRFRYVLAFGLYHNLEHTLDQAVRETHRVLEAGGVVCASFRADNVQTRLTDWLADRRSANRDRLHAKKEFHKINLKKAELARLFSDAGFSIDRVIPVENMPFLYKFRFFRSRAHRDFDENKARSEGYRLSAFGRFLQNLMMRFMPEQFCNIYVVFARKA